jgi:FixH
MKFNWGTGITIFFIFFATCMITLVVATARHPPQMMQKEYYALDLNYQAHLEKKQHTASLPILPQLRFDLAQNMLELRFPEGMTAKTGTFKCYRSATTHDDMSLNLDNVTVLKISGQSFVAGRWHVEADWQDQNGIPYFWESTFIK